jgi:hypothetical protein
VVIGPVGLALIVPRISVDRLYKEIDYAEEQALFWGELAV